ncbi:hypothetical protein CK203_105418 [Vitis vinifera]|uniref:Uncharacterized protein n=1 Tax=Vitis vinifera TaxID=29760 RepID=A0A438CQI0_VITVI|nr:hypothetical protein CK203_105418 [Vitis vinifera]
MNIVSNFWQLVSPSNEGNEGTDGNQAQATPNKTGCAGDEKIEAKKVVMDVTCPMGLAFLTGLFTVLSHSMELAIMVCFIGYLFPSLLYLLGPLILPEEFVWSLVDIVKKIKTKIHSFCLFHSTMLGSLHSTVLVLVEANDSDLLVSLNNAGESPLFMAVDARASEIVKTILQNQIPILFSIEVPTARRFYTGPF